MDTSAAVLNVATRGVGVYDNFPYNSLFPLLLGGKEVLFGVSSQGLHQFADGQDDNGTPVIPRFVSGVSNLGDDQRKVLSDVYVEARCESALNVDLIYDEEIRVRCSADRDQGSQGVHFKRFRPPRGLKGTHLQVVVTSDDGAALEMQSLRIITVSGTRRVRHG